MPRFNSLSSLLGEFFVLLLDPLRLVRASLRTRSALAAENLFLRKQGALYLEPHLKPRQATAAANLTLVLLSRLFAWQEAVAVVEPDTLIRWHQKGFRLFWR